MSVERTEGIGGEHKGRRRTASRHRSSRMPSWAELQVPEEARLAKIFASGRSHRDSILARAPPSPRMERPMAAPGSAGGSREGPRWLEAVKHHRHRSGVVAGRGRRCCANPRMGAGCGAGGRRGSGVV